MYNEHNQNNYDAFAAEMHELCFECSEKGAQTILMNCEVQTELIEWKRIVCGWKLLVLSINFSLWVKKKRRWKRMFERSEAKIDIWICNVSDGRGGRGGRHRCPVLWVYFLSLSLSSLSLSEPIAATIAKCCLSSCSKRIRNQISTRTVRPNHFRITFWTLRTTNKSTK